MNNSGGSDCRYWTWGIALVAGVLTAIVLWVLAGWSFLPGAFMGILVLLILGALLMITMCSGASATTAQTGTGTGAAAAGGAASGATAATASTGTDSEAEAARAAEQAAAAEAEAAAQAEADAAAAADAEAARVAAAEAEAAQAAADAAAQAEADAAAAQAEADAAAAAEAEAARVAAAEAEAAAAASAAASATEDYDGDGVHEGADEGTRPEALDGPRGGTADDLKRIKGIGPKLEQLCNSLGFYHFDQIAGWSADEVAWVNANLQGFKGRVSRDEWVAQARLLAAGGETEFSKKVDDGDVY